MPRQPDSFEGAVAKSIEEWLHRMMPAVAEALGPLPDSVEPTQREKLERWNLRTREVPPEAVDLLADEALKMILDEHAGRQQPIPDRDTLTKLVAARVNKVLYPWNAEVYGRGTPRPADRIREAERYQRLAMKEQPAPVESAMPALPAPTEPAPTPAPEPEMAPAVAGLAGPDERGY